MKTQNVKKRFWFRMVVFGLVGVFLGTGVGFSGPQAEAEISSTPSLLEDRNGVCKRYNTAPIVTEATISLNEEGTEVDFEIRFSEKLGKDASLALEIAIEQEDYCKTEILDLSLGEENRDTMSLSLSEGDTFNFVQSYLRIELAAAYYKAEYEAVEALREYKIAKERYQKKIETDKKYEEALKAFNEALAKLNEGITNLTIPVSGESYISYKCGNEAEIEEITFTVDQESFEEKPRIDVPALETFMEH